MMWHSTSFHFAGDHPTAAGHFPGNPIIPGALMLDVVVAAIAGENHDSPVMIKTAKFLQAVRPGEQIELRWQAFGESAVKFECRIAGQSKLAMTGTLDIGRLAH